MSKKLGMMWGLLLSASLVLAAPVRAEETAGQSTADADQSFLQKYGKANYLAWLTGPRTEALSGNRKGGGTSLTLAHYFTVGAKLGQGFSLTATQPVSQYIDEEPESVKKQLQPGDPYLTLSHGKILHSDRYAMNLDGYIRYYIPVSRNTSDGLNSGMARDGGRGVTRVLLNPSKSFLDGKLTFNGLFFANFRFASNSPGERLRRQTLEFNKGAQKDAPSSVREDMYFVWDPSVVYSVSSKLDIYVEYATGYLRHTTNGKWSSINHPDDGQYVSPGVYWNPTKKIYLNPYLSYQLSAAPIDRGLTKMDIGIQAQYTFL